MNIINFVLIRYFPEGGWEDGWGKIENKDHLSPAKAEIGAELGNIAFEFKVIYFA